MTLTPRPHQDQAPPWGEGGTPGSLNEWLDTYSLNVADYGATADGVTDDTAAIQAAIDAIPADGGVVFFPAGLYKITSTLTVQAHNVILKGIGSGYPYDLGGGEQGGSLVFAAAPFTGTYMISVKLAGVPTIGVQGFRIDGMVLSGGGVDVGGIQADTQQGYFTNTQIALTGYHALELTSSAGIPGTGNYNNVVSQSTFLSSGRYANGGDAIRVGSTDNKIIDNWFYGFYNDCIGMRGSQATHLQVYGNHLDALTDGGGVGGAGIYADNAAHLEVVGNSFNRNRGAIKIENTAVFTFLHITDNTFTAPETASDDNTFDAIYIANTNTVYGGLISDNIFCNAGFGPFVKWRYGVNVADAKMKNLIIGTMSDQISLAGAVSSFGTAPIKNTGSTLQTIPRCLAQTAVSASHTGDLADTTLATITIPAMATGLTGRIRVTAMYGRAASGASSNATTVYFGGTLVFYMTMSPTELSERFQLEICNRGSLGSQVFGLTGGSGWGLSTNPWGTSAIDTSADVTLLLKGQLANAADTVTLDAYLVEVIPG